MINAQCLCVPTPTIPTLEGLALYPGAASVVPVGGASVVAVYGGVVGALITNPLSVADQNVRSITGTQAVPTVQRLAPFNTLVLNGQVALNDEVDVTYDILEPAYGPAEPLYVSLTGPATLTEGPTTHRVDPGQTFVVPPGCATDVWVNATTSGHRFSAVVYQPRTQPAVPYAGAFPPAAPTGKTTTIPSYLYKQYQDDDDLQALVAAHNATTQSYVDWFNALFLPVFPRLQGALLDWVGAGLYGIARPTLFSNMTRDEGPLNTFAFNDLALNDYETVDDVTNVAVTSDDVYKRIIAWHTYKGDGRHVTASWLKRRVTRFLYGANGLDYPGLAGAVSVVAADGNLAVTIVTGTVRVAGGAVFNESAFNECALDEVIVDTDGPYAPPPLATIFQEAVATGALEMPAQYAATVAIGTIGVR